MGLGAIGGIIGNLAGQGDRNAANDAYNNALNSIASLQIPDIEKQKLILELPQVMGQYTPEQIAASNLGPSRMESLDIDPAYKDAQMAALNSLSDIGKTGLTAQDMAELNKVHRGVSQGAEARNQAILQDMASRGMGGSGAELIAKLTSSQNAADMANQQSDQINSQALQRKMAALQNMGNLGGQLRQQEYGEQTNVAQAADAIAKFNVANQNDVSRLNTQNRNDAQLRNLQEKQRIADQQASLKNQEQQYNKQLQQAKFENEYRKQAGMAGQYQAQGARKAEDAVNTGKMWTQIGEGAQQGVNAIATGGMSGAGGAKK